MMTETGKETLSYFGKNLSDQIRGEIEQYLKERKYDLKMNTRFGPTITAPRSRNIWSAVR